MLIACPKLKDDVCLKLTGKKLVSQDYIIMTTQILKRANVRIKKKNEREYVIPGKQTFKGLKNFTVPSDYGLAAFQLAAAALVKSDVTLRGSLSKDFIQADGHIIRILKKMGVRFVQTSRSIKIKGPFQLKGGVFSLKDCPDLVPIVSILALFAKGTTKLCDIAHARAKESDRISDLRNELLKIGADVRETKKELIIVPKPVSEYKINCSLDSHHDHRLAMSFAVLGLKVGVRVKDIECSHKSYPGFVKDFKALGARISPK